MLLSGTHRRMAFEMRKATEADAAAIEHVMRRSTAALGAAWYDERQLASAVLFITTLDLDLVRDQTYFVVEQESKIVACGGWSSRRKLFAGGRVSLDDGTRLDPILEAARIRAMFVHPDAVRRGLGRQILAACEEEVRRASFTRAELMATLPGIPLYRACGYDIVEETTLLLGDGVRLPAARMQKRLVVGERHL
jgi:GNAT superfamily N-acetyltransferase